DVDHLDDLLLGHAAARGGRRERVEIYDDEVERVDPVRGQVGQILRNVPPGQDAAVDSRVQGDDAVSEQLGEARDCLQPLHRQPVLVEERGGAAARHELPAELVQSARENLESRPVVDRDQRTRHSSLTTSRTSRCSTSWIRWTSVDRGSTGTGSCRSTGPVSMPSSTRCTVTAVSRTPASTARSIARRPGNAGSREGWTLTIGSKRSRNAVDRRRM